MLDFIPNARQELRYATTNNFTGQVIYDFSDAYLRFGTVKKLVKVAEELEKMGLGLYIWDGYRPVYAQQRLWDVCPDPNYVSPPGTGKQAHCRGMAVDLTLYDLETGALLEMPSDFDEFSALGDRDYSDCTLVARESALILENAMENAGFVAYWGEWWHFSDSEEYELEQYFDPSEALTWTANCNEYINLRADYNGNDVIGRIHKGETFQVLQWKGTRARVLFNGITGWANAPYLMPARDWLEEQLELVKITAVYSYEEMMADLTALADKYPDLAVLDTAGTSEQGRTIPALRIGDEGAAHHVLTQGAMHGREHATAWLLMAMAETWLEEGGFANLCIHILPMVNPDGVVISQTQMMDDGLLQIYDSDRQLGYTRAGQAEYLSRWKANALGVDINRNFAAGWDILDERQAPSSQGFRGTEPFSAAEARALRDYTLKYPFDVTVSYHASGSLTYYEYGDNRDVNKRSLQLARAFQQVSGYAPTGSSDTDGGGYKDWAMDALGIPSLTVEIGCAAAPLHQRELYSAYVRNVRLAEVIESFLKD